MSKRAEESYDVFFVGPTTILVWLWDMNAWLDLETTDLKIARSEWFFVHYGESLTRSRMWRVYRTRDELVAPRMVEALDKYVYCYDDARPHPSFYRFLRKMKYEFRRGPVTRVPPVGHVQINAAMRSRREWKERTT